MFRWIWIFALFAAVPLSAFAGEWELGGAAGFGFYRKATISAPSGTAEIGFGPRVALAGYAGKDLGDHFGGEFRFIFRDGDLELSSGSVKTALDAFAGIADVGLMLYPRQKDAKWRPFFALGGGLKFYNATEIPSSDRPLQNFALLEKASQVEPLVSLGGGINYAFKTRWLLRLDFRDYFSPFPEQLISPVPGASVHGGLHDFTTQIGVSHVFGRRIQ